VSDRPQILNVPRIVTVLLVILIAIHITLQLLPRDISDWWLIALAFVPARYDGLANQLPGGDIASITSFITHMLVHGDVVHLAFNSVWLLAFGGALAKRVTIVAFVVFTVLCGIAGAATFWIFNPGLLAPMIGASGALSGLMAAMLRLLFSASDQFDMAALRTAPWRITLSPLSEIIFDRRLILVIAVWVAVNMLAMIGFDASSGSIIAWQAHIGGFLFGLLFFGCFDFRKCEDANHPPTILD
jgi:membrane associated rhomboid family serine protease